MYEEKQELLTSKGISCLTISSRTGKHFPSISVTPSWELVVAPAGYNLTAKTTPLFPANQHNKHGMQHKDYDPALHNS
jgi:hypothetical protein